MSVANIKIKPEHEGILVQIVESDPTITLMEIRREFTRRTGMSITKGPVIRALERQGVVLVPSHKAVVIEKAAVEPPRYGYTDAHRRLEPEQDYPSSLTDSEWTLVVSEQLTHLPSSQIKGDGVRLFLSGRDSP
jgi:hypothetical protein